MKILKKRHNISNIHKAAGRIPLHNIKLRSLRPQKKIKTLESKMMSEEHTRSGRTSTHETN